MHLACKTALCCFWTFDCQVWFHAAVFLCFINIAGRAAKPFIVFIKITIKMIRLFLVFATLCDLGYTWCVYDHFYMQKKVKNFSLLLHETTFFYRINYFFLFLSWSVMIWHTIGLIRNVLVFQRGPLNCSRLNGGQGGVGDRETGARMSKPLKVED